uniref:asparaginase n=1 Tax=Ascaris lumbricoides TaxID=6252 RepID=A0A0M3IMT7_ASCLU
MSDPYAIPDCEEQKEENMKDDIFPLDEYHTPKQLMLHTGTSIKLTSASQLASTVSEDLASLKTAALTEKPYALESRVLVLYTGGTIGMKCIDGVYCPEQYYLPRAIRELPPLNDKEYIMAHYGDAKVKPYCLPPIRHMKKRIVYWQLASTVSEDLASLKTAALTEKPYALESRVLVLYTGGTIGMKCIDGVYCPEQYYLPRAIRELPPLNDKEYIMAHYGDAKVKPYCLPPIRHMKKRIVYWVVEYEPLLDSSDMTYDDWIRIGKDIRKAYEQYDGFVVLHGTDTLAYTACALSFMLENLGKPVIITGAQIPVCEVRSDGRENLIGALIIAGNFDIPEVTVFFNNKLLRGNRSTKLDNSALEAFDSPNMAPIAQMEITIKDGRENLIGALIIASNFDIPEVTVFFNNKLLRVNYASIYRSPFLAPFSVHDRLCRNVGLLRIFPSISIDSVRAFLRAPTQGVVLQTFGAGNMSSRRTDIIEEIKHAVERGCIVVNCSQCVRGQVDVHYFTGKVSTIRYINMFSRSYIFQFLFLF